MVRLGETDQTGWTYFPVHTIPRALEIVWCWFPESLRLKPGPKSRPALVRAVWLSPNHACADVEVCYGTSKRKRDAYPTDLYIANAERLVVLGLAQATRFELDRLIRLPWAKEFFEKKDGSKTPVIGCLGEPEKTQLDVIKRVKATLRRMSRQMSSDEILRELGVTDDGDSPPSKS